jgi:ABC-type transport system substrate-binding protein
VVDCGLERREFLRRAGLLGVGLSLPGGVLSACGGDEGAAGGGVLTVGATDWLPNDFFVDRSLGNQLAGFSQIAWALFMNESDSWEFTEGLASGYRVSADGVTHTVPLRDGITFQDGSPIDAEAIAANLRGSFFNDDPLHRGSGTYLQMLITLGDPPGVKRVEVVDERTVAIVLTSFRADIRNALALIPIFSPEILRLDDYGTNVRALARGGSGPFRLTRFAPGDFAELEPYEGFFEEVRPARARLQQIGDPGALALALEKGDVAVAAGLAKADYDRLARSGFKTVVAKPNTNLDLVFSHPKDPAFGDARVRRAVGLAMNREAYVENFFNSGTATEAAQPIVAPGMAGFVPGLRPAPYDPDAARALLAEAGAPNPKLTLLAPTAVPPVSSAKALLSAMAEDLGKVGFDVTVSVLDGVAEQAIIDEGRAEAYVLAPGGGADPFILFDLYFGQGSTFAPGEMGAYPSIARDLAKAHATHDAEERDLLLSNIVKTVNDEALLVPIALASNSALTAAGVSNFPLASVHSWNDVSVGG